MVEKVRGKAAQSTNSGHKRVSELNSGSDKSAKDR
jgi:hypothetical protein